MRPRGVVVGDPGADEPRSRFPPGSHNIACAAAKVRRPPSRGLATAPWTRSSCRNTARSSALRVFQRRTPLPLTVAKNVLSRLYEIARTGPLERQLMLNSCGFRVPDLRSAVATRGFRPRGAIFFGGTSNADNNIGLTDITYTLVNGRLVPVLSCRVSCRRHTAERISHEIVSR
jgi:hypothetical protein